MLNKLYILSADDRFLIKEIGRLTLKCSDSTIYQAVKNSGLREFSFYDFGNCKVLPALELWRLASQPCFRRYYNKVKKKEDTGFFDKLDQRNNSPYQKAYKALEELTDIFWTEDDLVSLGMPGLTERQVRMAIRTGFIPSFKWVDHDGTPYYFVKNFFRMYWERELNPDEQVTGL